MARADIDFGTLTGRFEAFVHDVNGVPPGNVIQWEDAWHVDAAWFLQGGLAQALGGQWEVSVALESVGPGRDVITPERIIALDGRQGPGNPYRARIDFAAKSLPLSTDKQSYHVTALLTYQDVANTPGPIAAFVDLGVVMIYKSV